MTHEEQMAWYASYPPMLKKLMQQYSGEESLMIYPPDANGNFSVSCELTFTKSELIALGHELIALAETPRTTYVPAKKPEKPLEINVWIDPHTGNSLGRSHIYRKTLETNGDAA
jgi:hypothetical protein